MARNTPHSYQSGITHRVRLTVPLVIEVEVKDGHSDASAMVRALELLTTKLAVMPAVDRYSWDGAWVDAIAYGDIKHVALPLKPVPDPEPEEVEAAD